MAAANAPRLAPLNAGGVSDRARLVEAYSKLGCARQDEAAVTADQVRDVLTRLLEVGQWRDGDKDIKIAFDAGYDDIRLAFLIADLPVQLVGPLRLNGSR